PPPAGLPAPRLGLLPALRPPGRPPPRDPPPAPPAGPLPDALAALPPARRVGCGEAAARRSQLARSHGDGELLRDRAASHLGGLVRAPDAALGAQAHGSVHLRRGARAPTPHLGARPGARDRLRRHAGHAGLDHPHRELRLLQLPDDRSPPLPARRWAARAARRIRRVAARDTTPPSPQSAADCAPRRGSRDPGPTLRGPVPSPDTAAARAQPAAHAPPP